MQAATVVKRMVSDADILNTQISITRYNYLILEVLGRFQNLMEYLDNELLAIFDEINSSTHVDDVLALIAFLVVRTCTPRYLRYSDGVDIASGPRHLAYFGVRITQSRSILKSKAGPGDTGSCLD